MRADIMLASHSMVYQNRLFISGAPLNGFVIPFNKPNQISISVGLLVTISSADLGQHDMTVSLVDSSAKKIKLGDVMEITGVINVKEDDPALAAGIDAMRPRFNCPASM